MTHEEGPSLNSGPKISCGVRDYKFARFETLTAAFLKIKFLMDDLIVKTKALGSFETSVNGCSEYLAHYGRLLHVYLSSFQSKKVVIVMENSKKCKLILNFKYSGKCTSHSLSLPLCIVYAVFPGS